MTEGLVLMGVGMATVFAFLILLVVAMQLGSAFFKKFGHLFPETPPGDEAASTVNPVVAVALAAIRAKRG